MGVIFRLNALGEVDNYQLRYEINQKLKGGAMIAAQ
jgi:hypothetical protein